MFSRLARRTAYLSGTAWAFASAVLLILVWLLTGPVFDFSETWQLFINTTTTIITFLMVFLIQNAQNADIKAVHIKLDEIILSTNHASNKLVSVENKTSDVVETLIEEQQTRI